MWAIVHVKQPLNLASKAKVVKAVHVLPCGSLISQVSLS